MNASDAAVSAPVTPAGASLSAGERDALATWAVKQSPKLTARTGAAIDRLVQPIVAATTHWARKEAATVRNLLLREMHHRQSTVWAWDEATWIAIAGSPASDPSADNRVAAHRLEILVLGHQIGGHRRIHERAKGTRLKPFAELRFGAKPVQNALDEVLGTLTSWAVSVHALPHEVTNATLDILLTCASPDLKAVDEVVLLELLAEHAAGSSRRKGILKVARVLNHLGVIPRLLTNQEQLRGPRQATLDSVPGPWRDWALRWRRLATQEPVTVSGRFSLVLVAGRWAAEKHPEALTPDLWTRDIAAEYVADTLYACHGQWAGHNRNESQRGQPLSAKGKAQRIDHLRAYFCDLIEWEWIRPRFDPRRVLSLPLSVRAQLGPNPRVIDDASWAKLMAAGLTLNVEDLNAYGTAAARSAGVVQTFYPIEMVRALVGVWLFAGLRSDEIRRLEPDCVVWDQTTDTDTGEPFTACLLRVPQNKTSRPFSKPVDPVVGQLIEAWKLVRPTQPMLLDRKTGQKREFLFCHRGQLVGGAYLNARLIPVLCRKAAIPESDSRGALTSHRARTTIATQLLNAREPLTMADLQQWLGHKHPSSTRYYAEILQRTLTAAYRKADYFARNVRTIQVLIDRESILTGAAAGGGQPWKYYDLGDGYCSYDFFAKCPHRLACARCPFYVPKEGTGGRLLEVKEGIETMLEQLELTDDERIALEGDRDAVGALAQRLADTPTPAGPTPNQLGTPTTFIPLTALRATLPSSAS